MKNKLSVQILENYLHDAYKNYSHEQSLFMKLVEEVGEVAELLNKRAGRKFGDDCDNSELANELVDVIHYTVAIAAINHIDLETAIIEKDKRASIKYNRAINLENYIQNNNNNKI